MSSGHVLRVAAIGLVCAGTFVLFRPADAVGGGERPATSSVPSGAPAPPSELSGRPTERSVASGRQKEKPVSSRLLLPDGTSLPVLNGAYGAPPMSWPKNRPWSPIVRKKTDAQGLEWYVHRDGSHTITQNAFHTHLGRFAPVTNVFTPERPLPPAPEEVAAQRGGGKAGKAGVTAPRRPPQRADRTPK